jgi:hypothetical protein
MDGSIFREFGSDRLAGTVTMARANSRDCGVSKISRALS